MNKRITKKHAKIIDAFQNQKPITFTKYQSNVILHDLHIKKITKKFPN